MTDWEFEHTIHTKASREVVWDYMSNMHNHAEWEADVKRIELDGPFETGTTGRTVTDSYTQEWKLTTVIEGEQFVITGHTPDGSGSLSFSWRFEDADGGTRMTQRIEAAGQFVSEHMEELRMMSRHAPESMEQLGLLLDQLSE